jgi:hypothetical protein
LIPVLSITMFKKQFKLYVTINKINGKVYGGKHYWYPKTRYMGSGYRLRQSINKYGRENFETRWFNLKIDTPEDLDRLEIKLIRRLHHKFGKSNCYNIQKGGRGGYYTEYMDENELEEVYSKISNGLKEKYKDPEHYEKWKESLKKRKATMDLRKSKEGKSEKEIKKRQFMLDNGFGIVTYEILYPDGKSVVESKTLRDFLTEYKTEDHVFSRIRSNGEYMFKKRTKLTKHPFPVKTIIKYISEIRTFNTYKNEETRGSSAPRVSDF